MFTLHSRSSFLLSWRPVIGCCLVNDYIFFFFRMEALYNGQLKVHFGVDIILYFDCCYSSLYAWCKILGFDVKYLKIVEKKKLITVYQYIVS